MTSTDIVGLLIIVISLVLQTGRGSFLIAGYNTLSREEKEKYNSKKLGRFIGRILFPIGLFAPILAVGGIYEIVWLPALYSFGVIALSVFAVIYCNTGNRFKK
jgi:hypothetical protein